MSWKDTLRHPIPAAVIASLIVAPLSLFNDVVRKWVVTFFSGLWSGLCAFGRWLATPVPLPLWLVLVVGIVLLICVKVARVYRERALAVENQPARVEHVEAPARGGGRRRREPEVNPEFHPTDAQRRIIELLARVHPGSQSLSDLNYATRLPTQAHTEREAEGLVMAGIVRMGNDWVHGSFFNLTPEGRDYALDNGMFGHR